MAQYSVIVGNVGEVWRGQSEQAAHSEFHAWVDVSQQASGSRGYSEGVYLYRGNSLMVEYCADTRTIHGNGWQEEA